ncbi:MAG: hypothetical protein JWP97_1555 [Labilithrix sp.]|nr:hypothetical protein [Labilithrix sp.]
MCARGRTTTQEKGEGSLAAGHYPLDVPLLSLACSRPALLAPAGRLLRLIPAVTVLAWGHAARAECPAARTAGSVASLPEPWRAAVHQLVASTSEAGHPWSCSGGTVEVELGRGGGGGVLRVAREGEPVVAREVSAPADVVPLGQALLAAPLDAPVDRSPPAETPERPVVAATPTEERSTRETPRVLLGAAIDGRAALGSGVAWVGPQLRAGITLGSWLANIDFRQQSAVGADGPPLTEVAVGGSVQRRFPLKALELRAGVVLRGAAVFRDLPRPQGSQSELQGRAGAVAAVVVPLVRWASLVLMMDGELVVLSRKSADPASGEASSSPGAPKSFPSATLGGSIGIEVAL